MIRAARIAKIIASILSAIGSAAFTFSIVDSTGGQISSATKQKENQELINKLSKDIAKDQDLARQLVEGFEAKGASYANAIMNRSPFSTSFHKLTEKINENSRNLKEAAQLERDIIKSGNITLNQAQSMPSGSGSLVGDLVTGGAVEPTYKDHQTKLENLKERL